MSAIEPEVIGRIEEKKIEVCPGLKLQPDGTVKKGLLLAVAEDVPVRDDLPKGHPFYGQRIVRNAPSGLPDCVIDNDGKLEPAVPNKPAVEPVEVETEIVRYW